MRLMVITTRYPTHDRPAAGAFIRDRLADPALQSVVVAPRTYNGSRWGRLVNVAWRALTTQGRFDGVEVHFVLPAGPIGLLAARLRGVPLVVVAHGTDVRSAARRSGIRLWLARRVVRGATAVIATSADTAEHVSRLGRQAEVIPPGVALDRFRPSPRPSRRRVLYLGGEDPGKGVDVARALADTMVGPGLHEVDPGEIPDLIAAHDIVLVPSREEGYGLVAAEAIASGRWVVASAVGGLADVVSDGVNGSLVADGTFAEAIAAVPDYDPMAVAATADRFDITRQRAAMRRVWDRVLATRRISDQGTK